MPRTGLHQRTRHRQTESAQPAGDQIRGVRPHSQLIGYDRRVPGLIPRERQHDLPDVPGLRHVPECVTHLRNGERRGRQGLELAHRDLPHHLAEHVADGVRPLVAHPLEIERRVREIGPEWPETHRGVPVDVAPADLDEASVGAEHRETRGDCVAGKRIEHDVDPRAARALHHFAREGQRSRIQHVLHAQALQVFALGGTARGGEDRRARALGDLHRGQAHATRRGVDQHAVAAPEVGQPLQGELGGDEGDRHGRGNVVGEGGGLAHHEPRVRNGVRAQTVESDRHHLVPDRELRDIRPDLDHSARALDADWPDTTRMTRQASERR